MPDRHAPDDFKHQSHVSINLTDLELRDAALEANRLDKKTSELIRYTLRLYLYGNVGVPRVQCNCDGDAE